MSHALDLAGLRELRPHGGRALRLGGLAIAHNGWLAGFRPALAPWLLADLIPAWFGQLVALSAPLVLVPHLAARHRWRPARQRRRDAAVRHLPLMLEGQVVVLGSTVPGPDASSAVFDRSGTVARVLAQLAGAASAAPEVTR